MKLITEEIEQVEVIVEQRDGKKSMFIEGIFLQGDINNRPKWGRDHHPYAFTLWMAGGGIKPGISHGASDELGMNAIEKPVHIHDLQATLLHQLGIDHERLTYRFQGRYYRLTDVHGQVVRDLLS